MNLTGSRLEVDLLQVTRFDSPEKVLFVLLLMGDGRLL